MSVIINTVLKKGGLDSHSRIKHTAQLIGRAKTMSRNMTHCEQVLWFNVLSKKQLLGLKFTKQKIIYNYILDFYCSELLLCIEVDGETHNAEYDLDRDKFLNSVGITVIRIPNKTVLNHTDILKQKLESLITQFKSNITSNIAPT
jgi:very-short-patch-repair endonuclease